MHKLLSRREFRATATFIGTIIGAGVFGVPYVMAQTGVGIGLIYFAVLLPVLIIAQTLYGRITLAVPGRHRLPGYANAMLGRWGKEIGGLLGIFTGWTVVTVYIIIGGTFLYELLAPVFGGTLFVYQIIFASTSLIIMHGGLRAVGKSESLMASFLLAVIILLILIGLPKINVAHFTTTDWSHFFLPYGVILFALSGMTVIPELKDLLAGEARRHMIKVLVAGKLIAAIVILFFGLMVVGVTGAGTTPEAIVGLGAVLGRPVIIIGALFGFLAIITSFFTFLMNQQEMFVYDFKMKPVLGWLLAIGVPLVIFLFGSRDFIRFLGLTGGFFGGLIGALIMAMYIAHQGKKGRPVYTMILPILIGLFFVAGAITELSVFFER